MHHLPSVFYCGFERAAKANDIMLSLRFKHPLNITRCWNAYVRLVFRFPALRATYRYDVDGKRYQWELFSDRDFMHLLSLEERAQQQSHSPEEVYSCFDPTGVSLPLRFRATGPDSAVFLISHVFADGRTTFAWLNAWCQEYLAANENEPQHYTPLHAPEIPAHWNHPGKPDNTGALIKAGLVHFVRLGMATFLSARQHCVDLSHNRMPQPQQTASTVIGHHFTCDESERIVNGARAANVSTAAYIHRALCSALFALYPECGVQRFGIASDVSRSFPLADPLAPGSLINPYIAMVVRNKPLLPQLARIYDEARAGAPVALLVLSSKLVPSHRFVENHVYRTTLKPTGKRQWLERLSFIYSHVRDSHHPFTDTVIESVSGHTKSQTVFVASTSLNGHLSLEFCATRMVFAPEEIARWFNAVKQTLLSDQFAY